MSNPTDLLGKTVAGSPAFFPVDRRDSPIMPCPAIPVTGKIGGFRRPFSFPRVGAALIKRCASIS